MTSALSRGDIWRWRYNVPAPDGFVSVFTKRTTADLVFPQLVRLRCLLARLRPALSQRRLWTNGSPRGDPFFCVGSFAPTFSSVQCKVRTSRTRRHGVVHAMRYLFLFLQSLAILLGRRRSVGKRKLLDVAIQ